MQARKHRRIDAPDSERRPGVSRKNFSNLVETEANKITALRELSAAVEKGNLLKEKELQLMEQKNAIEQERNQIFALISDNIVAISNTFFEIYKK